MGLNSISPNQRFNIIMYAIKSKNVSQTCKRFGISRTIYYRWLKRYKSSGIYGLQDVERKKPKMPNRVPKYIENEILKIVKKSPDLGPKRIYYKLKEEGFWVGETGIYNVLKRNGLNNYKNRLKYSKINNRIFKNENSLKTINNIFKNIEDKHAGYLLIQGTNYLGRFRCLGKLYQMTVIDVFSRFSLTKIYTNKKAINAKNILATKVMPIAKHFDIKILNIITNKSSEFTTGWENGKHKYEGYLRSQNINHYVCKKEDNKKAFKILRDFNETIYKCLYENIFKNTNDITIEQLEDKVQNFIRYYNFERPIKDGINKGIIPIELVTKGKKDYPMPLWFFINSTIGVIE